MPRIISDLLTLLKQISHPQHSSSDAQRQSQQTTTTAARLTPQQAMATIQNLENVRDAGLISKGEFERYRQNLERRV